MSHSAEDPWTKLARELGIEAGPAPEPIHASTPVAAEEPDDADEPPPEPEPEVEEAVVDEAPAPRGRRRRPAKQEEPAPEPEAPAKKPRRGKAAPAVEADVAEEEVVGVVEAEEPAPVETAEESEESADEGTDEKTGKRRRRRRSRRKKGPETVAATGDKGETAEVAANGEVKDEDEPAEEVSSSQWDIPSWNDLIASLHRPER